MKCEGLLRGGLAAERLPVAGQGDPRSTRRQRWPLTGCLAGCLGATVYFTSTNSFSSEVLQFKSTFSI